MAWGEVHYLRAKSRLARRVALNGVARFASDPTLRVAWVAPAVALAASQTM
jgi:hypothetical protein